MASILTKFKNVSGSLGSVALIALALHGCRFAGPKRISKLDSEQTKQCGGGRPVLWDSVNKRLESSIHLSCTPIPTDKNRFRIGFYWVGSNKSLHVKNSGKVEMDNKTGKIFLDEKLVARRRSADYGFDVTVGLIMDEDRNSLEFLLEKNGKYELAILNHAPADIVWRTVNTGLINQLFIKWKRRDFTKGFSERGYDLDGFYGYELNKKKFQLVNSGTISLNKDNGKLYLNDQPIGQWNQHPSFYSIGSTNTQGYVIDHPIKIDEEKATVEILVGQSGIDQIYPMYIETNGVVWNTTSATGPHLYVELDKTKLRYRGLTKVKQFYWNIVGGKPIAVRLVNKGALKLENMTGYLFLNGQNVGVWEGHPAHRKASTDNGFRFTVPVQIDRRNNTIRIGN